jgi:hypothetical protein
MMNAGTAVGGRWSLIEVKLPVTLAYLKTFLEDTLLIPEMQDAFFKRWEINFTADRFKHGVELPLSAF